MTRQQILDNICDSGVENRQYLEEIVDHGIYNTRGEAVDTTEENYESFLTETRSAAGNRLFELA